MRRNRIRLSEGMLRKVIKESVYRILNEWDDDDDGLSWYDNPQSKDDNLRKNRMDGLVERIEYYQYYGINSDEQAIDLKEVIDALYCFGGVGTKWAKLGEELLNEYNIKSHS